MILDEVAQLRMMGSRFSNIQRNSSRQIDYVILVLLLPVSKHTHTHIYIYYNMNERNAVRMKGTTASWTDGGSDDTTRLVPREKDRHARRTAYSPKAAEMVNSAE